MSDRAPFGRSTVLALPARAAARRFASRRTRRGDSRGMWLPIALRWRRPSARPAPSAKRLASRAAVTVWRAEYHLHLGERIVERATLARARASAPAPERIAPRPVVVHRHAITMHAAPAARVARQTQRAPGVRAAATELRRGRAARAIQPSALATPASRDTGLVARVRAHRATFAPLAVPRPPMAHRPLTASPTPVNPRSDRPRVAVPGLRPGARAVVPMAVAHEGAPSSVRRAGRTELVWRTTPWAAPSSAIEAAIAPPRATPRTVRAAAGGGVALEPSVELPVRDAPTSAPSVTTLDPALIDRLTDDVIRRVERRVRIDRERRGL